MMKKFIGFVLFFPFVLNAKSRIYETGVMQNIVYEKLKNLYVMVENYGTKKEREKFKKIKNDFHNALVDYFSRDEQEVVDYTYSYNRFKTINYEATLLLLDMAKIYERDTMKLLRSIGSEISDNLLKAKREKLYKDEERYKLKLNFKKLKRHLENAYQFFRKAQKMMELKKYQKAIEYFREAKRIALNIKKTILWPDEKRYLEEINKDYFQRALADIKNQVYGKPIAEEPLKQENK